MPIQNRNMLFLLCTPFSFRREKRALVRTRRMGIVHFHDRTRRISLRWRTFVKPSPANGDCHRVMHKLWVEHKGGKRRLVMLRTHLRRCLVTLMRRMRHHISRILQSIHFSVRGHLLRLRKFRALRRTGIRVSISKLGLPIDRGRTSHIPLLGFLLRTLWPSLVPSLGMERMKLLIDHMVTNTTHSHIRDWDAGVRRKRIVREGLLVSHKMMRTINATREIRERRLV
mmetsp:Transcript_179/g.281  ORF Transcript_179/g.281 Transcript_179/m.281 type:complete len:227 (-) Transcript_179:1703-2383(-)